MFDGIYLDPDTINIEMIVIFVGFTCIVQLTKNVKLAFWGGGLTFVVAVLQTMGVIPFQYYWILTIILTLGTIAYGLRKNASAREELKGKLMDVEKSIFLLPLILIVGLGVYAVTADNSTPKEMYPVMEENVAFQLPPLWEEDYEVGVGHEYSSWGGEPFEGNLILDIIDASSKGPSEILKDQENKIHLGKLANEDMNLDSKIEKENKIIGGQKGTILTYYFVEDWSINNPNEVSYCEDVFIPYNGNVYRFTFYYDGYRSSLFQTKPKAHLEMVTDKILETVQFQ